MIPPATDPQPGNDFGGDFWALEHNVDLNLGEHWRPVEGGDVSCFFD